MGSSRTLIVIGLLQLGMLTLTSATATVAAADFSSLVVFGDSGSDAGNSAAITTFPPSPPYFDGRFTNGPNWVDRLAERLGVSAPLPSSAGGTNYAFGGATTGSNSLFEIVTDMDEQVESYLSSNTPAADELFIFWGGGNDFNGGQSDAALPIQFISNHISAVVEAGARNVLVVNIPETAGQIDYPLAPQSNQLLSEVVATAAQTHEDVTFTLFDYVGLFESVRAEPQSFGFTNMVDPACRDCGVSTVDAANDIVPNPEEYFFWDDIHLSAAAHQIVGDAAFAAFVPEPATSTLMIFSGVVALLRLRIRKTERLS